MIYQLSTQKKKKKKSQNTIEPNSEKCENNAKTGNSDALILSDMIDLIPRKDLQPR